MAKNIQIILCVTLFLFFSAFFVTAASAAVTVSVTSFGAKPNGRTDSTRAFQKAWNWVCRSAQPTTMYVPKGRFLIRASVFRGPCRNKITVRIAGTLVAPDNYWALGNAENWILFVQVNRVSVVGGTLDARGARYWACRRSGGNCPQPARSLTFNWVNHGSISGLTSLNSKYMHIVINSCNNVRVQNVKIVAPALSPNTDGINIRGSTGVTISNSNIQTGDDCISIGPGTKKLLMDRIYCGPGHGISIGSLARDFNEAGVQDVTLTNSVFRGSDNGIRIKSWARPSTAYVNNIHFRNIVMNNVANPIIIDQNYCPNNQGCPRQTSGVKISGVTYRNIKGTSTTPVAVTFDCSPSKPCSGIHMHDIKLTYFNRRAKSVCKNIGGSTRGVIVPESCL